MLLPTLAARNLTRRRVRTLLTILGVAIAISFTVGILSLTEGMMASFEAPILANILVIFGAKLSP